MGIQINGQTDTITAVDGGLIVSGADLSNVNNINVIGLNATGIITATQVNVGTGVTIFGNTGIVSATEFRGNGANLTGVGAFAAGTLMLFQQTAAPTGWTKQTTHNDKALRVVSGSASSGGSTAFTSVFASRTPSGSVSGSNSGGSVSNTTLSTSEMPSHTHEGPMITSANDSFYGRGRSRQGIFGQSSGTNTICLQESVGGSSAHGHGFTNPSWSGSFTGTAMDFSVQYVDLIIASKN